MIRSTTEANMAANQILTENERALLIAIRDNEFQDGDAGRASTIDNPIWIDCISDWSDEKKFGGVMASLSKKGLAKTDGECCWLTQAGFDLIGAGR
jgi:hypothetical protein